MKGKLRKCTLCNEEAAPGDIYVMNGMEKWPMKAVRDLHFP